MQQLLRQERQLMQLQQRPERPPAAHPTLWQRQLTLYPAIPPTR
jgi:hypothetical protein